MGKIFHALTAILILLKVLGIIQISWLIAFAPSLIVLGMSVAILVVCFIIAYIGETTK